MSHGSPFDWSAAWGELAWRHARPHQPTVVRDNETCVVATEGGGEAGGETGVEGGGETAAGGGALLIAARSTARIEVPIALVNQVTGANNPKLERKHAQHDSNVVAQVEQLPQSGCSNVEKHTLRFAVTPQPEGEWQVGLVRIEEVLSGDSEGKFEIAWFERSGKWTFAWADNATFRPFMPKGRVEKQIVELQALLPVPVILTDGSKVEWETKRRKPSIAGSTVKLYKGCVKLLRTFIDMKRTDLTHEQSDEGDSDRDS